MEECGAPIKSIELQLVRVERTGALLGSCQVPAVPAHALPPALRAVIDGKESTDATEIQNLQVGDGDVARGLGIPLYMIFPRLFACPSVSAGVRVSPSHMPRQQLRLTPPLPCSASVCGI